jgi:hypothetical protein
MRPPGALGGARFRRLWTVGGRLLVLATIAAVEMTNCSFGPAFTAFWEQNSG